MATTRGNPNIGNYSYQKAPSELSKPVLVRISAEAKAKLERVFPPAPGTGIKKGEPYIVSRGPRAGLPAIAAKDIPARRDEQANWLRSILEPAIAELEEPIPPHDEVSLPPSQRACELLEKAHREGLGLRELAELLRRSPAQISTAYQQGKLDKLGAKGEGYGQQLGLVGWERRCDDRHWPLFPPIAESEPKREVRWDPADIAEAVAKGEGLNGAELARLLGITPGAVQGAKRRGALSRLGRKSDGAFKGWRYEDGQYFRL